MKTVAAGRYRRVLPALGAGLAISAIWGVQQASASTLNSDAGAYPCVANTTACKTKLGTLTKGTSVSMRCWYKGRTDVGTYSTDMWFLVRRSDNYEAFVHASRIPAPGQPGGQTNVGWCGNSIRVKAGLAAMARLGQVSPSAGDVKAGGWTLTGPTSNGDAFGPYGDWAGDCVKFARTAYNAAGKPLVRGNAWPVFNNYYSSDYAARGTDRMPLYGSLVGWNWSPGHIAVAVGGSFVATTIGRDRTTATGTSQPISLKNLKVDTSFGGSGYTGWVVPKGA